ncbi:pyridoxal phosphate-dependent aminotransferase [bacterium]|nr:pyridoxal phosphate-dependent aminotransferase [bacterium]
MSSQEHRTASTRGSFREVPYMGVIWVVHEAVQRGFYNGHPDWCNLGQGQPEVGEMAGAPPRLMQVALDPTDHAYGPLGGTDELREVIAAHYNRLYRQGKSSQYTKDNVSVASGGRLALTRVVAALADGPLAYQVPDYTAYEDLIGYHAHRLEPVLLEGREENGFQVPAAELEEAVRERGARAFIYSNPCNPTGNVVSGDELARYCAIGRDNGCTMLHDEFYSHFIYNADGSPGSGPVSAAAYVEDVEQDPQIIIDGLTKSFRYPGWRCGWAIGPREMIEAINRSSSAIDGGPSRIVQRAALEVLQPQRADQETTALREVFARKRGIMLRMLGEMGITTARDPQSTFYIWASIANLPDGFNDADEFFFKAIERRVMTVPGRFFNVDPRHERGIEHPYRQWVRFSFGPPEDNLVMGLTRLQEMLREG